MSKSLLKPFQLGQISRMTRQELGEAAKKLLNEGKTPQDQVKNSFLVAQMAKHWHDTHQKAVIITN